MKIKKHVTILLIIFILASCAPAAIVDSTAVPVETSTTTPIPPTSTSTPIPSATPVPFSLSGNYAVAEQDRIYIYSTEGKNIRTIQTDGWVKNSKFSHYGKMVAYSAFNKIRNDLIYYPYGLKVIGLENNQKHTIVDGNTRVLNFFWSEAGDSLIYLTLDGAYKFSMDETMKKERLAKFPAGIFEKPNETGMEVYPSPDYKNFVVTQVRLKQVGENRWQDDGFNVYYFSTVQDIAVKLNDKPHNSSSGNEFGGWSQGGRYFYYRANASGIDSNLIDINTFVFNASSALLVDSFPNPHLISWSPDGNFVSQSQRENRRSVLINNGDFTGEWNEIYSISSTGTNAFNNMVWSPDSKLLALSLTDFLSPSVQWLGIYDAQNRQIETLVDSLGISPGEIIWSPDGEYLLITITNLQMDMTGICQFRIYSFSKKELMSVPDVACTGIVSFRWSLDGKLFAFTTYSEYSQEIKTPRLYVLEIETATIEQITVGGVYNFELIR